VQCGDARTRTALPADLAPHPLKMRSRLSSKEAIEDFAGTFVALALVSP